MVRPAIRPARAADLPAITALYNHYVEHTPITFDVAVYSVEQRQPWFEQFSEDGRHRLFVAEQDGALLGYAGCHGFRPKAAYATSVETTIYLQPDAQGRGLGSQLYATLFDALQGQDVRVAMAGITLPNDASLALHRRFGFQDCGVMRQVGRKHDRYWDVAWMQRFFEASGDRSSR